MTLLRRVGCREGLVGRRIRDRETSGDTVFYHGQIFRWELERIEKWIRGGRERRDTEDMRRGRGNLSCGSRWGFRKGETH